VRLMKRQVTNRHSDLPRLAPPEARRLGDFRRLLSVSIDGGEIRGEWPETTDTTGYWNLFDARRESDTPPYMAFVNCGGDDLNVKHFMENYGPIGEDLSSDFRKGSFSLAKFNLERWRFRFTVTLCRSMGKSDSLRKVLLKGVEDAWGNVERIEYEDDPRQVVVGSRQACAALPRFRESARSWRIVILHICDAAGITRTKLDLDANWYRSVRKQIETLSTDKLVSTARCYLSLEFWEKMERIRPALDFPDSEAPRLTSECPSLLAAFYWMLAMDLHADGAPLVCANCKGFFFSKRKGSVYCARQACKELGRRRLDWERNKRKYNRNRKRKREAEGRKRRKPANARRSSPR